jgi:hypothetical protein
VATPLPQRAVRAAASPQVESLEDLLEGDRSRRSSIPPAPREKSGRGIWIAVFALLVVGGGAVVYLVKAGLLGRH